MLRQRSQFLASLLYLSDVVLLAAAWLAAYAIRFSGWPVPVLHGVPSLADYLIPLFFVAPVWALAYKWFKLYRAGARHGRVREMFDLLRGTALAAVFLTAAGHFAVKLDVSRLLVAYFAILAFAALLASRYLYRRLLSLRRRNEANLRRVLIVGSGELAQSVKDRLDLHPEMGLEVRGFLTRIDERVGQVLRGAPVLANVDQLQRVLREQQIDVVFIAVPNEALPELDGLVAALEREPVDINVVPDLYKYALLRGRVEEFEDLPILSLSGSPMTGWGAVAKRTFDVVFGVPLFLLALPVMGLAALAVRATSGRGVLYRQERMGLDGRTFTLLKFRTMSPDAERETGPRFATRDDPRRTRIGSFLRQTSLDELPQLWNVILGEMSLVGPRPERPVFIENFRASIPKYMLRHRVKAGLTGWAQVNGWRGDTSIEKRLDHDLHYIRNWSMLLDLKILLLTVFRGFSNRNAY